MNDENNNLNNENNNEVSVDNFFDPQEGETLNNTPLDQENSTGLSDNVSNSEVSDNLTSNTELNPPMPSMDIGTQTSDEIVDNGIGDEVSNNTDIVSNDNMNDNTEMTGVDGNNQQDIMPNTNEVSTNFNGPSDFSFSDADINANNGVDDLNDNPSDLQKSINVEQPNIKNDISSSTPGTETNIDMNGSTPVNATINVEQPSVNPEPMNNIGVQDQNTVPPQNITIVNKKSNKGLIIVLIIVMILAIAAAIGTYFLVIKKNSKTNNEYENPTSGTTDTSTTTGTNTGTGTSTDEKTIENDGLIYTKKSGYNYQVDDGLLYAYNNSSAFQISAFPVSYDTLIGQLGELEEMLTNEGCTFTNKKETVYSGKKVTSYEVLYDGKNALYFMYPLEDNYSMVVIAYDKSNSIKYNLVNEAINLTSDVKKSDASTSFKNNDASTFSSISDSLFD